MATQAKPGKARGKSARSRRSFRPPRSYVYFDTVRRTGSMRKAASELNIASSALNRQILLLEDEIGVTLLERLPRGVRLTAAGEVFAGYVRRALSDLESVSDQIESLRGLVRGRVSIAAAESVMSDLLPRLIVKFQAEHPGVHFNVTVGNPEAMIAGLVDDTFDLIVTHDTFERRDIAVIAFVPQAFCALVATDHPLAGRKRLLLRDCQSYPIALADDSLAGRVLLEKALATASFKIEPTLVSNSVEAMKAYARQSQAICFQFKVGCAREIADGTMVAIPLGDRQLSEARLIVAGRRERVLPVAAAAFVEVLVAAFNEADPPLP